jgi:hypothetical protein
MQIVVSYRAVDGYRAKRKYKSLAGARKYAVERVGPNPDFGSHYAVSDDGVGVIEVDGCSLKELFGIEPEIDWQAEAEAAEAALRKAEAEANRAYYEAEDARWAKAYLALRPAGCVCSEQQLNLVGCDCDASNHPF